MKILQHGETSRSGILKTEHDVLINLFLGQLNGTDEHITFWHLEVWENCK